VRCRKDRKANTSFLIIDALSVGNTDTTKHKGFDEGKKVLGIKLHIWINSQGLHHLIAVTTANATDRQGALARMRGQRQNLAEVTAVLVDSGYRGKPFEQSIKLLLDAEVTVAKRNKLHQFAVIPKRWVVERSFAWLGKCRRRWKNREKLLNSSLQMVSLALLRLMPNKS
jgi:transposase